MRGTKLAMLAQNGPFWHIFRMHGELCTAAASNKPRMANFFVHKAQQHGDIETTDTTAIADTGQHETIITTARPQQGNAQTDIATAPKNCAKNAHFAPAKATAVSTPHRHKCAKATEVSDNPSACPTGPGCGAGGRRQGQGGPRDRPLRAVRLACGDLAGGPPPTDTHSGPARQRIQKRPPEPGGRI